MSGVCPSTRRRISGVRFEAGVAHWVFHVSAFNSIALPLGCVLSPNPPKEGVGSAS